MENSFTRTGYWLYGEIKYFDFVEIKKVFPQKDFFV